VKLGPARFHRLLRHGFGETQMEAGVGEGMEVGELPIDEKRLRRAGGHLRRQAQGPGSG
jgi:hypothetical protein